MFFQTSSTRLQIFQSQARFRPLVQNYGFSFFLLKAQQLIPIILILLLSCFNLRWQAARQIIADYIKTVKDRNNAFLFFNGRYCNYSLCYMQKI